MSKKNKFKDLITILTGVFRKSLSVYVFMGVLSCILICVLYLYNSGYMRLAQIYDNLFFVGAFLCGVFLVLSLIKGFFKEENKK